MYPAKGDDPFDPRQLPPFGPPLHGAAQPLVTHIKQTKQIAGCR
jgi:hypothetical protein